MPKRTRNETPQKQAMREMMSVLLEGVPDEELDEELGYSKYDYRSRDTDYSRNGHSSKTKHTSYWDMDVAIKTFNISYISFFCLHKT